MSDQQRYDRRVLPAKVGPSESNHPPPIKRLDEYPRVVQSL